MLFFFLLRCYASLRQFFEFLDSCVMNKQLFPTKGDGRVTTVVATPGYGPDRQVEVQYSDAKVLVICSLKLSDTTVIFLQN